MLKDMETHIFKPLAQQAGEAAIVEAAAAESDLLNAGFMTCIRCGSYQCF